MPEDDERERRPDVGSSRRPYVTPAIEWEQPFEVQAGLASACGKIGGQGDPCDSTPAS